MRSRDERTSRAKAAAPPASLSGAEKVAVLLLALGKARAAKLLKRFDAEDLKLLTRSAADLRPVRDRSGRRWWRSSRRSSPAASTLSAPSRRSRTCCRAS